MIHLHKPVQIHKVMRLERSHLILCQIAEGTLPTDEKKFDIEQALTHQNERCWRVLGSTGSRLENQRQNPQLAMVWAAVTVTASLVFVPSGVTVNTH